MKTTTFLVLSLLFVASFPCFGLNYTITFTGSGASTSVGAVIVQNLTKGTSLNVPAGYILNLSILTAVEQLSATDETIHVYPNSVEGKSTVSFFAKQAGVAQINAFGMDGRKIVGISANLQAGINSFQLSLAKGTFAIQVSGKGYAYTAKMINQTGAQIKPEIAYIGNEKPTSSNPQKSKSSTSNTALMTYTIGDCLLYKATSGIYSTIVTDVPTASKTINFNFVACTDGDGNNYTTVTIGNQIWMAENLKTTKFNDFTAIPNVTDNTAWTALSTPAYCWYNNVATYYKDKYGALYNWYTVNTAKLAPTGWHVPTDTEWTTLTDYVSANLGTSPNTAKALATTTDWTTYSTTGTVGCNLILNNSTGFSALPYCFRNGSDGTFDYIGNYGYWWSSSQYTPTTALYRNILYYYNYVYRNYLTRGCGLSVRCVKDN